MLNMIYLIPPLSERTEKPIPGKKILSGSHIDCCVRLDFTLQTVPTTLHHDGNSSVAVIVSGTTGTPLPGMDGYFRTKTIILPTAFYATHAIHINTPIISRSLPLKLLWKIQNLTKALSILPLEQKYSSALILNSP